MVVGVLGFVSGCGGLSSDVSAGLCGALCVYARFDVCGFFLRLIGVEQFGVCMLFVVVCGCC